MNQIQYLGLIGHQWLNGSERVRKDTLCKNYESGSLKKLNIVFKIITLQSFWVKQLYDSSTHDRKLIPYAYNDPKIMKAFFISL